MDFFDAREHLSTRLSFFENFIRKFSEPDVQAATLPATQDLFGFRDGSYYCGLIRRLSEALDEVSGNNNLAFHAANITESILIRQMTQLALQMDNVIPHEMIPTPEDLHALKTVADFGTPFTGIQRMRNTD